MWLGMAESVAERTESHATKNQQTARTKVGLCLADIEMDQGALAFLQQ